MSETMVARLQIVRIIISPSGRGGGWERPAPPRGRENGYTSSLLEPPIKVWRNSQDISVSAPTWRFTEQLIHC